MDQNISILIPSCDNYSDLWAPFFKCFFKYWPDCPYQIFLGVNKKPFSYPGVSVINTGLDNGYSQNLREYLDFLDNDIVLVWIEDRFLKDQVSNEKIDEAVKYFKKNNLDFLKLITGHPYSYSNSKNQIFSPLNQNEHYWVCLTIALWKKSTLYKIANLSDTAWDLEKFGTKFAKEKKLKFYSISYPYKYSPAIFDKHLLIKGKLTLDSITYLRNENIISVLRTREKQSLMSFIYVFIYNKFFDMLSKIKNMIQKL